jgi:hypothetical protein
MFLVYVPNYLRHDQFGKIKRPILLTTVATILRVSDIIFDFNEPSTIHDTLTALLVLVRPMLPLL